LGKATKIENKKPAKPVFCFVSYFSLLRLSGEFLSDGVRTIADGVLKVQGC
jgi:hypothetical protein